MLPVVTVTHMNEVDRQALEHSSLDELVARAGSALARHARRMLGSTYGKRVVVVAGKGNNGADGKVAASHLRRWGVRTRIVAPGEVLDTEGVDLIIDAAFGTGFKGSYRAPETHGVPVLACDMPSGVDGDTGIGPNAVQAEETVTFGALKSGLLFNDGPSKAGPVYVEPIGLELGPVNTHLATASDIVLPPRLRETNKWKAAVTVLAGSPGMLGAGKLCSEAAFRTGAGYVTWGAPGCGAGDLPIGEHVGLGLAGRGWQADALDVIPRHRCTVVGPGLGRSSATAKGVSALLATNAALVIDADAIVGIKLAELAVRKAPTVLTPHDGELAMWRQIRPGSDRVAAARALAAESRAVILLKGPTTVVAEPGGRVVLTAAAPSSLATAGTGDVLSGTIGGLIASGVGAFDAAWMAAHVHGAAAQRGYRVGLTAGDLPELMAAWLSEHAIVAGEERGGPLPSYQRPGSA